MCHPSVHAFVRAELDTSEIAGRRILEVGSRDVNGSVRPFLVSLGARDYVGVDMVQGPGVDRVCDVGDLAREFAGDPFEVVVTTEMLEHVRDWRIAIHNLKRVVAPGGLLVITTRSYGFPYHDFPGDYWRYELDDMRWIFRDFQILSLVPDSEHPGIFLKCLKPAEFREADTSGRELFSMVKAERAGPESVSDEEVSACSRRLHQLTEIGMVVGRALATVELADAGQRDFRSLWRTLARLADLIQRLPPVWSSRPTSARWRASLEGLRREVLELLTAVRLIRGRFFGRARVALIRSAVGTTKGNILRIPWARVEEEAFREILATAESVRTVCLKVQSYARPAARV